MGKRRRDHDILPNSKTARTCTSILAHADSRLGIMELQQLINATLMTPTMPILRSVERHNVRTGLPLKEGIDLAHTANPLDAYEANKAEAWYVVAVGHTFRSANKSICAATASWDVLTDGFNSVTVSLP